MRGSAVGGLGALGGLWRLRHAATDVTCERWWRRGQKVALPTTRSLPDSGVSICIFVPVKQVN